MRRFLFAILCLLLAFPALAQQQYKVFENKSNARWFDASSSSWEICEKNSTLSANTVLKVSKKNGLRILDVSTNRIYSNVETGSYTVRQLVKSASSKSDAVMKNLNKELERSVNGVERAGRYSTYGATSRGDAGALSMVDSLYCSIYLQLKSDDKKDDDSVETSRVLSKGTVSFVLTNHTEKELFCQVIKFNGESASFCYNVDLNGLTCFPVMPLAKLDLTPYAFLEEAAEEFYLLYCESPIPTSALTGMLLSFQEPKVNHAAELIYVHKIN